MPDKILDFVVLDNIITLPIHLVGFLCKAYPIVVSRGQTAFIFRQGKRVWNSSQVPLVLTPPDSKGSVNKRNVIHF